MTYSLINKNGVIIGYSEIDDKKGTFFEKYQKLDFLAIIVQMQEPQDGIIIGQGQDKT